MVPTQVWPPIIESMVTWMREKNLPISHEEIEKVQHFYLSHSPSELPPVQDDYKPPLLRFASSSIGDLPLGDRPQITSLKLTDIDGDGISHDLIVTDNLNGTVSWLKQQDNRWQETVLARSPAPVNSTPMDIDGDGDIDFGISIMGEMHPNDRLIGQYHLLLNEGQGRFKKHAILQGNVPRITDSAPADFDGDGDLDIVLAMFGWRTTGAIGVLEQTSPLKFRLRVLLPVNGAMRVIPCHLNDDAKIDFLCLITQEHETIARFINLGALNFRSEIIARANHPTFGSSSIFVEDLDQDGDEDILYTNGDMMDHHPEPKPYHGVRWLENTNWTYKVRPLASMPGCYDAKPCDMDGDGDLDVVISALYFQWKDNDFPSLAWLENKGGFREFVTRRIAYAPSNLANIAVGDINSDGKPDIFGGGMHVPGPTDRAGRITLWQQE